MATKFVIWCRKQKQATTRSKSKVRNGSRGKAGKMTLERKRGTRRRNGSREDTVEIDEEEVKTLRMEQVEEKSAQVIQNKQNLMDQQKQQEQLQERRTGWHR